MSPLSPTRRRAERFEAALEGASTVGLDRRTGDLLDLVGLLRTTSTPPARPDFVSDLRSHLLLAAETELTPAPVSRTAPARATRSRRERRIAVALGGFALVGATASMALAAQSALPDDLLYPLKRAIEDADTSLSAERNKGPELLSHASSRLSELDQMTRGRVGEAQVPAIESTLATFSEQADDAAKVLLADYAASGDQRSINRLRVFAGQSLSELGLLEPDLPAAVRPFVLRAAQTLFRIDDAATRACPECQAPGITQVPGALVSALTSRENEAPRHPLGPVDVSAPGPATRPTTRDPAPQPKAVAPRSEQPTTRADPAKLPVDGGALLPITPEGAAPDSATKSPAKDPRTPTGPDLIGGLTGASNGKQQGIPTSAPSPVAPLPEIGLPKIGPPKIGGVLPGAVDGLDETTQQLLP